MYKYNDLPSPGRRRRSSGCLRGVREWSEMCGANTRQAKNIPYRQVVWHAGLGKDAVVFEGAASAWDERFCRSKDGSNQSRPAPTRLPSNVRER